MVCRRNTGRAASSAVDLGGGVVVVVCVRDEFEVGGSIICMCEYFVRSLVKSVLG